MAEEEISLKKQIIVGIIQGIFTGFFTAFIMILIHFGYQPFPTLQEVWNSNGCYLLFLPIIFSIINILVYILLHTIRKRKKSNKQNH